MWGSFLLMNNTNDYLCSCMKKILFILLILFPVFVFTQINEGGFPLSNQLQDDRSDYGVIELSPPDVKELMQDDLQVGSEPAPLRIGIPISRDIDLVREGTQYYTRNGERIIRLAVRSENARGLILYYKNFSIPAGGRLFIYNKDKEQVIGAFTRKNNPSGGYFATEMIKGDELIMEYNAPANNYVMPDIQVYEVHYIYRDVTGSNGSSGPCEVNINCSEGNAWQNEKKAVAKIFLRDNSGTYLCTGSLINNTRQDSTPYLLTARHCGSSATTNHYSQWVFYFNYESPGCEDPQADPPSGTIVGCELIAQAPEGTFNGSDFKLLRLEQRVPDAFNPWFAGWRISGETSGSGVGIHHPQGDLKKISTYKLQLTPVEYSSSTPNSDADYWRVIWSETENGYGVTEGGSSGSALFDNTGKIIGTLTGGAASCSNPDAPDYYGRFSKHWVSNGNTPADQLRPWLDPDQLGVASLDGFGYGNLLSAGFSVDTSRISVGGSVQFSDLSTGDPDQWEWTFYGGSPSSYIGQTPGRITYDRYGEFHVALVVQSGGLQDSILKEKFVRVTPNIFPVPADEYLVLDFGNRSLQFIEATIIDMFGNTVKDFRISDVGDGIWQLSVADLSAGNYILRVKTNIMEDYLKFSVF
jgi:hypothetical protein